MRVGLLRCFLMYCRYFALAFVFLVGFVSAFAPSYTQNSITFHVNIADITPPTINITSPMNISYATCTGQLGLNATSTETISVWWYNLNYSAVNNTFIPVTVFTASNGSSFLQIWANDTAGNIGTANISFFVNLTTCIQANQSNVMIIIQDEGGSDMQTIAVSVLASVAITTAILFLALKRF